MIIDYLAHHKHLIPEIVELSYGEWGRLFDAAGVDKAHLAQILEQRAVTDALPIAVVALQDGALIGTGSIKLAEPGTRPGLSPWLAGMYVKEAHRGGGTGAQIVRFLEAKAKSLGVAVLYLSVGKAPAFYERLGWTVVERLESYGVKEVALMSKTL